MERTSGRLVVYKQRSDWSAPWTLQQCSIGLNDLHRVKRVLDRDSHWSLRNTSVILPA